MDSAGPRFVGNPFTQITLEVAKDSLVQQVKLIMKFANNPLLVLCRITWCQRQSLQTATLDARSLTYIVMTSHRIHDAMMTFVLPLR